MSRILVVVYSYTGASRTVAGLLADREQWTLAEVRDAHARLGLRGTWRCLLDSLLRRCPEIRYTGPDPAEFDAVVLVSPIWAARLAGPMRSFVAAHRSSLRDVAVISVMGDSGAANAVAEIARWVGRRPLMETAFKTREVADGSCVARLQAFGRAVQQAKDASPSGVRAGRWSRAA